MALIMVGRCEQSFQQAVKLRHLVLDLLHRRIVLTLAQLTANETESFFESVEAMGHPASRGSTEGCVPNTQERLGVVSVK
jgi:hypothetical protein